MPVSARPPRTLPEPRSPTSSTCSPWDLYWPRRPFRQSAELTRTQRDLLAKLKIQPPKKIIEATPAAAL
jgi:hypothetical protein